MFSLERRENGKVVDALQVNPRYVPQLQAVLCWPQSAGIVGGRPSSSLYFVGYQDSHVIFLDPHLVQEVSTSCNTADLPKAFSAAFR